MSQSISAAARVILAAHKTGTLTARGIAAALDDAGLLAVPGRVDALLARVAELEATCARLARQAAGVALLPDTTGVVAAAEAYAAAKADPTTPVDACPGCAAPPGDWCPGCGACLCDPVCGCPKAGDA
ncbi:hypothetical protein ABZ714_34305 [Streptomyces sp. NPDC006798]|uniref:hypothetical protein n=1 Tax=Streptomyces sp. NPDC006798 TaxID=3155462 RepID=UPI0033F81E9F